MLSSLPLSPDMTAANANNLAIRAGDHSILLHITHDAEPNLNQGKVSMVSRKARELIPASSMPRTPSARRRVSSRGVRASAVTTSAGKLVCQPDGHIPRSSIGRPDPSGPLFHVKHASPQAEATRLKGGLSQWAITLAYRAPAFGVPRET